MSLKVLHMSSEASWRGGEQQIAYLIEELLSRKIQVHVAVKSESEFEKYCIKNGIPHYPMPFKNAVDARTANKITRLCQKLSPDVIHMHSSKSHGIGVLSAMLGNTVPFILSRRVDFIPKNNFLTRLKYNHSSIKRIICVSHKIDEIIQSYIEIPSRSVTIHSGIDTQKFSTVTDRNYLRAEFSIPAETFLIGNTSALEHHKDYFTFLDTIKILATRNLNIKAFIIGAGSLNSQLMEYARKIGVMEYIIFTGFRKDILQVLPSLNLFLITSNEEGLGTSVLDAFAAGVPVAATAAGGIPEMVIHEKTGMLAPIRDSIVLADSIEKIMTNDDLKNQLIANAREKIKEFSKEQTAAKTLDVYNEVVRESRPLRHK